MTRDFSAISTLPETPAVYALYAGRQRAYVAYVGVAGKLRSRMVQHFLRRDSSVTTGTSAVSLDPDQITELVWWENSEFGNKDVLEAAELVAFDVFEPTLRSRGGIRASSHQVYQEHEFNQRMRTVFESAPSGRVTFPDLRDAFDRISQLETRLAAIEEWMTNE